MKVALILSSIITPLVVYFLDYKKLGQFNVSSILLLWIILFAVLLIIKKISEMLALVEKFGEAKGKEFGEKLFSFDEKNKNTLDNDEKTKSELKENLLNDIMGLAFVGEYITLVIALIPLFCIHYAKEEVSHEPNLINSEIVAIGLVTFFWIYYLEKLSNSKIKVPLIPIPINLKWAIVVISLILLYH